MSALCPHGQGECGGQPNVDMPGQGEPESQKFRFVRTSFMHDPDNEIIKKTNL